MKQLGDTSNYYYAPLKIKITKSKKWKAVSVMEEQISRTTKLNFIYARKSLICGMRISEQVEMNMQMYERNIIRQTAEYLAFN